MAKDSGLKKQIDRMVMALPEKERQDFRKKLVSCLGDRYWCETHEINYSNPNVTLAKAELYRELYCESVKR